MQGQELGAILPAAERFTLFVMGLRFPRRPTRRKRGLYFPLNERGAGRRQSGVFQNHVKRVSRRFSKLLLDASIRNEYDFVKCFLA